MKNHRPPTFRACLITLLFLTATTLTALTPTAHAQIRVVALEENPRMAFLLEETDFGFTAKGTFRVDNPQESSTNVELTPTDGARTSDGTFAIEPITSSQKKLGAWINLDQTKLTIDSREELPVDFTITVPKNTPSGIYHGAIVATATKRLKRGENGPVTPSSTVLPIFIKVPGPVTIDATFDSFSKSTDDKKIYYNFQISNRGNTIIVAQPTLVSKFFGIFSRQTSLANKKLFPGDSINFFTFLRQNPFPGIYIADGHINFAEYDIFTDTEIPISLEKKSLQINHKLHYYLLIPILTLLWCAFRLQKKISLKRKFIKGVPYSPKPGETLQDIATIFHIKWEKLAAINSLLPPFSVTPTTPIIIPRNKMKYAPPQQENTLPPDTTNSDSTKPPPPGVTPTITSLLTLILLFHSIQIANSQSTEASVEIKSGAIFIEPPESINLATSFIPDANTGSFHIYKTLTPDIYQNLLFIHDYDTAGINYKIGVSVSNLNSMEIPHSIIPFSNFSLVSLAVDTQAGVDLITGTPNLSGIELPAYCPWNTTSGTLEQNCSNFLNQRIFRGDGPLIETDPVTPLSENTTLMQVADSSLYHQGDILKFLDTTDPFKSAIDYEKALVVEVRSPTELEIIRGISGTTSLPHSTAVPIKNFGSVSLEQDLFVAPEVVNRAAIYSMGFGVRGLLEPALALHPGAYAGTVTFTLYTCSNTSCL